MLQNLRLVWDLPTRVFHWLLVLTIIGSYITAKVGLMPWHQRLGLLMIGMLIFRVVWGLIGPRHARFSNFIKGPATVLQYLKGGIMSAGHNPLGAGMVVLMLLLLGLQATTGLFSTDDVAFVGPYFPSVSHKLAEQLTGLHHTELQFHTSGDRAAPVRHHVLHVREEENGWSGDAPGYKPPEQVPAHEAIAGSQLWKALIVIAVAGGACSGYCMRHRRRRKASTFEAPALSPKMSKAALSEPSAALQIKRGALRVVAELVVAARQPLPTARAAADGLVLVAALGGRLQISGGLHQVIGLAVEIRLVGPDAFARPGLDGAEGYGCRSRTLPESWRQ